MRITAGLGGLLLVTQIVLLAIQLHVLNDSHAHIRSQDAKQTRLYPLQKRTARETLPLIRQTLPLIHDARGLVKPLRDQSGSIQQLVDETIPAMRGLRQLIAAVFDRDMLTTLERTAADTHAGRGIAGESLERLKHSEAIQTRTLAILEQSLAIQQQSLQHIESIDRKTGGSLPAP
jgi:hypothetical protein